MSEKRICFCRDTAPILNISYRYIFTACYAMQFSSFSHEKYTFKKFLKTNYKRTTIAIPQLTCTYQSMDFNKTEEFLYFEVDVTVSLVSELNLGLGLIDNSTGQENCDIYGDVYELRKNWSFNISEIYHEFEDSTPGDSTSMQFRGKYRKLIAFNIKPIKNRHYCFYVNINDERCEDNSLWKPSYKNCYPIPTVNHIINMAKLVDGTSNYIYWIIIVTSLTGLIIFMTVSFVYIVNTHIWKKHCITAGQNNQKVHKKSNLLNVSKDKDTLAMCTDIVLLYPKGPESFMSLMAEFRELLGRACQCSVHDWYNATECNYVAEMGGCNWFAEMLNKGCRIIWIDTPTSRLLIAKKFKSRFLVKNSREYKFDEISDFRDLAFTAIFDLAKHNIEQSIQQQHKHFIVRLKGFEIFDNENDPFLRLYPDTRYVVPQDLNLLCSNLSLLESNVIIPFISGEDKFIEHLWCHSDSL
ncbi:uncharacterized protein LOC143209039 isoform X2 [Lasioglossum baleicum]